MATVLVVESNYTDRRKLIQAFERRGVSTVGAHSLDRAKSEVRRSRFDAAIVNVAVDDGSGLELLAALRRRRKFYIALLCDDDRAKTRITEAGIEDVPCFVKPLGWQDIHQIKTGMASRRPRRRSRSRKPPSGAQYDLMVGDCPSMREIYSMISKVAPTDSRVLISGESGSGKELVASSIHQRSGRRNKPFIAVNCGAIPENLIESELFGHVKGAFTGANNNRRGVFEQAHGGTLFLDEIGEMPMDMQVRLLRVLETGTVTRVGGEQAIKVDTRVLAATNRDPNDAIADGRLREDLVYRLSVFPIKVPPLRERADDILLLAHLFLDDLNKTHGQSKVLTTIAEQRLEAYSWPGNVRQLHNVVERGFIIEDDKLELKLLDEMVNGRDGSTAAKETTQSRVVSPSTAAAEVTSGNGPPPADDESQAVKQSYGDVQANEDETAGIYVRVGETLQAVERKLIEATLEECDGDKPRTAKLLGISLRTLYNRLRESDASKVDATVESASARQL